MTRAQAIARIKERLGIDLRWPTTYARFLQWRQHQRIQNGLAARLEKFRQFDKQCDLPASLAALEATAVALFLEQAILQQDAALFLSLLRLRLRERTLALKEKQLALAQDRLQLAAAPQDLPAPPPVPSPIGSPQCTDSPTPSSPIDHSKPPEKHTSPAPNPKVKTQLYDEKHNLIFSAANKASQSILANEFIQPSPRMAEGECGKTTAIPSGH